MLQVSDPEQLNLAEHSNQSHETFITSPSWKLGTYLVNISKDQGKLKKHA